MEKLKPMVSQDLTEDHFKTGYVFRSLMADGLPLLVRFNALEDIDHLGRNWEVYYLPFQENQG